MFCGFICCAVYFGFFVAFAVWLVCLVGLIRDVFCCIMSFVVIYCWVFPLLFRFGWLAYCLLWCCGFWFDLIGLLVLDYLVVIVVMRLCFG